MKRTALIMAGGHGERFWPKSRRGMPKQFLSLTDDGKTMIQATVERILPLVSIEDIFIATGQEYASLVYEQLPGVPKDNILCEPVGKNTAPCIGLGAVHMSKKYDDATMLVLPSDHLIRKQDVFRNVITEAIAVAEMGENLITIGITPDRPETGYGYIKFQTESGLGSARKVEQFVEKPDIDTARRYLKSHQYLWNSGMFIWKVSTILKNLKRYMPQIYRGLQEIGDAIGSPSERQVLEREFTAFQPESIDYGVMEKAENIYTLSGEFIWDDVGSWLAVERLRHPNESGNVINGNVIAVDTKNTIIQGDQKLIATVGLEDLIVVDTADALLICGKDKVGDVRKVLEGLSARGQVEYM